MSNTDRPLVRRQRGGRRPQNLFEYWPAYGEVAVGVKLLRRVLEPVTVGTPMVAVIIMIGEHVIIRETAPSKPDPRTSHHTSLMTLATSFSHVAENAPMFG